MKNATRETQCSRLLDYMKTYGRVTCLDGYRDLGIVSFPRRILDLKRKGYKIESTWITVKNRYQEKCTVKEYRLATDESET